MGLVCVLGDGEVVTEGWRGGCSVLHGFVRYARCTEIILCRCGLEYCSGIFDFLQFSGVEVVDHQSCLELLVV